MFITYILQNDWEVVKRGWDAQVLGEAPYNYRCAIEAVKKLRAEPKATDQYLPPFVIVDESGKAVGPIADGDAVVTFNFRADRMVMLAKALEYKDFDKFDRIRFPKIRYAGMLQYDGELQLPSHYLVSPPEIERTSGEYLVHNGIRTFACRYSNYILAWIFWLKDVLLVAQVNLLALTTFFSLHAHCTMYLCIKAPHVWLRLLALFFLTHLFDTCSC